MSNKKTLMNYIKKPIVIIPTIILLLVGGLFTIYRFGGLGFILILVSLGLMVISFIEALIAKKWLKGLLYFISYGLFLLVSLFFLLAIDRVGSYQETQNFTSEFYNDKLNTHLASDKQIQLTPFCKQNEYLTDDYSATCIFTLSDNQYKDLISKIDNNKNFERIEMNYSDMQVDLSDLECPKEILFKNNVYESVNNSETVARIIISADNSYCLFNIRNIFP